jgi:hypothetical protein
MKISKIHKKFSYYAYPPLVLSNPQNYLGPNWEALINFWLYLDTLRDDQLLAVRRHCCDLSDEEWSIALDIAWDAAKNTVGSETVDEATSAVHYILSSKSAPASYATYELIGLGRLLDQGYKPVFFPLFINL